MHAVAVGAVLEFAPIANQGRAIDWVRHTGDTRADRARRRERGFGDGRRTGKVRRVFQGCGSFFAFVVVFVHRVVKKGAPPPARFPDIDIRRVVRAAIIFGTGRVRYDQKLMSPEEEYV